MMQPQADRNLLFGVLAFQLDFIGRDQFVAAMNAWVLDKRRPLGQILVEHKALRDEDRAALEVLVDCHLERHDQQPEGSLGALSIPPELRWDLGGIADAELHASLARLPTVSQGRTPFQPAGTNTGQPTPQEAPAVGQLIRRRSLMAATTALLTAVVVLAVGIVAAYREQQRREEVLAAESEARRQTRRALDELSSQVMADWLSPWGALEPRQRDFLERALAYYEYFAAESGDSEAVRHSVADAQRRIGIIRARLGRHEEAEAAYRQAQELYARLTGDFPAVPKYRKELALSHYHLGVLLSDIGRPQEAEAPYRDAFAIQKALASDFPAGAEYRQDLAQSHNRLGILLAGTGRLQEAEAAYRDAVDLCKRLATDSPGVPEYQGNLANAMDSLAEMLRRRKDYPVARQLLEQAWSHLLGALAANPRDLAYWAAYSQNRQLLAATLLDLREHGSAAKAAADLARGPFHAAENTYNAASVLSRCVALAEQDTKLSEARRKEQAKAYADQALAVLRQAIARGYNDIDHLKKDQDLDPLRQREDFKKLRTELDKDDK
jgi:tetratricopeptide (TPR) repeat protein